MKRSICLVTVMAALVVGSGCRKEQGAAEAEPRAGQPAAQEATPIEAPATNLAPHVCFANIANALDPALLKEVTEGHIPGLMPLNIRVAPADAFGGMERFDLSKPEVRFGAAAKLVIYVVNDVKLPYLTCVPGHWALVNVRGLDKGLNGDGEKYKERLKKVMLKGLGYAAGVGGNQDTGRCVMAFGSFETLEGIDSTSATYSPFAQFPMMDFLAAKGVMKLDPAE